MTGGEAGAPLVGVAVPVPLRRTFTYSVPEGQRDAIALGARVLVPFGRRSVKGTVVAWPAPERGASPFEAAARRELERRVEAALARLPLRDRELLLLVGVEGLTPAEAAGVCGVPAVTLRARLHRAREKLAAEMDVDRAVARARAG